MKKILVIIFSVFSLAVTAADYYVSSAGNDLADGRSSSTPWRTILKVNSEFSKLNSGDRILFKSGDTFYGGLVITKSGISGNPITIGSYDTGTKPVISGFTTLKNWTNEGTGIYSAQLHTGFKLNNVTVNEKLQKMGRWPNTGWRTITSHLGRTSITDNSLTGYPDWTNAEVVIRKNRWTIDRSHITNHGGNLIEYKSGSVNDAKNGFGYFIQKSIHTLDEFGEWYYNEQLISFTCILELQIRIIML